MTRIEVVRKRRIGSIYIIEPMCVEDLPEVIAIEKSNFSNPWPRRSFVYEIEKNPFSHPTIARTRGTDTNDLAGYCVKWVVFDHMHIQNIAVHPQHQRRGLGRYLLEEAFQLGKTLGAEIVELEVRKSNVAAQRLYESMGFTMVGKRKRYYSKPREDALLYEKKLYDED